MSLASILANLSTTTVSVPVQDMVNIGDAILGVNNMLDELKAAVLSSTGTPQDIIDLFVTHITQIELLVKGGELLNIQLEQDPYAEFQAPECPPAEGGGEGEA
jgi:hypothetical protein